MTRLLSSSSLRAIILFNLLVGVAVAAGDADLEYFEQNVRPLLSSRCFSCHGEKKQESELRLDNRASILLGGATGDPAAVVGDPDASPIVQYVRREVEGMEMPPDKPLSDDEVAILEQWVKRGLVWPNDSRPAIATMDERLQRDKTEHWAFQAPAVSRPDCAAWPGEAKSWPATPVDEFVMDVLLENRMQPSQEADRRTLLRRLKFDLLGLPPSPEEVERFVADDSPGAYARVIDRFLASPHYGERWGRHWMDVARYADTRGYTFGGADRNYKWAYTYRDYVIGAWNADLPYDQFVLQQLAADQLELGEDNRALAGLGFLTVGRKFNNSHDDIDEKIDAVTRGFVGLTVACARCHDHKYDAIPTEDYYSLYGVFNSSHEPGNGPLIGDATTLARSREYEQQLNAIQGKLNEFENGLVGDLSAHVRERITDYLVATVRDDTLPGLRQPMVDAWRRLLKKKAKANEPTLMPWSRLSDVAEEEFAAAATALSKEIAWEAGEFLNPFVREAFIGSPPTSREAMARLYGSVLTKAVKTWQEAGGDAQAQRKQPAEVRQLLWYFSDFNSPGMIDRGRIGKYLTDDEEKRRETLKADVDGVKKTVPVAFRRAMVMLDKSTPSDANVFIRGSSGRPGDKVARQSPALIALKEQSPYANGSGRLELAQDIIHPQNPLTARVLVNRVWMHHFGRPLVDTPSDFGVRCEEPIHRKLLDYLAVRFMQSGWSIKSLHREILLSATYRQASGDRPECYEVDPENRLLWRMNRRRLEFEVMRDALLSASGTLDLEFGGTSVRMFRKPERASRRSVYGYIDRQDLPNLLRVFDFAGPDQSVAKRADTTIPQQSLFLMNSPFVLQQAKALSAGFGKLDDGQFAEAIYQRLFTREPTGEEREVALRFLASATESESLQPREQLAQLLLLTNEFAYVD